MNGIRELYTRQASAEMVDVTYRTPMRVLRNESSLCLGCRPRVKNTNRTKSPPTTLVLVDISIDATKRVGYDEANDGMKFGLEGKAPIILIFSAL